MKIYSADLDRTSVELLMCLWFRRLTVRMLADQRTLSGLDEDIRLRWKFLNNYTLWC